MDSLWTHPERRQYPSLRANIHVDVAIVGAGLSGIGAAHALKGKALKVAVLEARTVASGASGRNAGFLLAGPAMLYSDAVGLLGAREAQLLWGFTVENNEAFAALITQYEIDCGYLRRGSMVLAASAAEAELLTRAHADLIEHGISCCPVSSGLLPKPFDRLYLQGLYYPGNAELDPAAFTRTIAHVASDTVSIYEDTAVLDIERVGSWRLKSAAGSVEADIVLICTNAFTNNLLSEVPIECKRGQVLATEPLPEVCIPFPMYADRGFQYWRQTHDGRVILGGWRNRDFESENSSREELNPTIHHALDHFLKLVIPNRPIEVDFRWAGIMGFTPDNLPLVGELPTRSGVFLAAGYSGHGVAMAFTCGSRLALSATEGSQSIPSSLLPGRLISAR